jgi:hypothetical protein
MNYLEIVIRLEIKQNSEGYHHVPGVVEAKVDNICDVWNVLQAGSNARAVGSNNVNEHSSRSHWYEAYVFFSPISLQFHVLDLYINVSFSFSILANDHLFLVVQHAVYNGKG